MTEYNEKRERLRVDYVIGTEFILENGEKLNCIIRDISMGGAFLLTEHPLPAQSKGQLKITLRCGEEKKEVLAHCVVIRSADQNVNLQEKGMAVQILEIDPDSSIILYNVVKFQAQ